MILHDFIETLFKTGCFGRNKVKLVIALFSHADAAVYISESAAKSWLKKPGDTNGRSCRVATYFPENSVNEQKVIKYFKQHLKGTWKQLQNAFQKFEKENPSDLDFRVDLRTENPEKFYWSLLNQFQRILRLPETDMEDTDAVSVSASASNKMLSKDVRDYFLGAVRYFQIMEIINRTPPVLNREDSARINVFLDRVEVLITDKDNLDFTLYATIKHFIEALQIKALSLDACMNNRFGFGNDNASVNMGDDETPIFENPNKYNLPTEEDFSELLEEVADPIAFAGIIHRGWGHFRKIMNILFDEICSWPEEK